MDWPCVMDWSCVMDWIRDTLVCPYHMTRPLLVSQAVSSHSRSRSDSSFCHDGFGSADKLEIVLTLIIIARPTLWLWYSSLYCRTHNWALGLRVSANAAATATITARVLEILVIGQNTRQGHPESLISRLLPSWCEITPSPSPSHYRATQQCHQR